MVARSNNALMRSVAHMMFPEAVYVCGKAVVGEREGQQCVCQDNYATEKQ
jgi:hypothetical protein